MKVLIHPLVTIYINTLLAWAKCFLATYGVYPGLYDLLDTPRHDFLAAQLHLRDSTLPRLLLHQSRGPPTIRKSICSFAAPHSPSPPPRSSVRLSHDPPVLLHVSLSCNQSVCPPANPPVCLSPHKSVELSIHPTDHPSITVA